MITGRKPVSVNVPWWIHPSWTMLFIILPINLICLASGDSNLKVLNERHNYIDIWTAFLSCWTIFLFFFGSVSLAGFRLSSKFAFEASSSKVNRVLLVLGALSIISYIILLAPIAINPRLIALFFSNSMGSSGVVNQTLNRISGVTSFLGLSLPFASLLSASRSKFNDIQVSRTNRYIFWLLIFFATVRSIIGSERLAIIELLLCYYVPGFAFSKTKWLIRVFTPIVAISGLFFLFSIGSYFRDWPFHQGDGLNFLQFEVVDFFGYFSTSVNNGAGVVTVFDPIGFPAYTVDGISHFLSNILHLNWDPDGTQFTRFLNDYGNLGFNNRGGLFVPYMDYGFPVGSIFIFLFGLLTGWLYKRFRTGQLIGLVLYPTWFVGILDILRVWHWGDAEFWPAIAASLIIVIYFRGVRFSGI